MKSGIFVCPLCWEPLLPPGMEPLCEGTALAARWDLLVLTPEGCRLNGMRIVCRQLLVPGDCPPELVRRTGAETVVTYGMSCRDSLTYSSLE